MAKVHARGPEDKIVITLNEKNQPISENQKIITELTNFVGSLAKDNVSLTYINWRLVPKELKNEMWDYTRVFFKYRFLIFVHLINQFTNSIFISCIVG